jgi:hypothetical protein
MLRGCRKSNAKRVLRVLLKHSQIEDIELVCRFAAFFNMLVP